MNRDLRIGDLRSRSEAIVEFVMVPDAGVGQTIMCVIDPTNEFAESDEGNETQVEVAVKSVRDIHLAYLRVDYLGSTPMFPETVANSGDYLKGVYPVAPDQFNNQLIAVPFIPNAASFIPSPHGAASDASSLWLQGKLLTGFGAERIIGIVPERWFSYHGMTSEGVVFPMVREAAFVLDNRPLVTAHELGHTYGIDEEGYILNADGSCCSLIGPTAQGYWVSMREPVTDSIDYMGASAGAIRYPEEATVRWSTVEDYEYLFRQFAIAPNDPEVLLITGTIDQDSTVGLDAAYLVPEGVVTASSQGSASVDVLNAEGNVIHSLSFDIDFRAFTDPPTMLDIAPFAFALPYSIEGQAVQIASNGEVLFEGFPTGFLLHEAIDAIPDFGFVRNAHQRRKALHNKIDQITDKIGEGDFEGANNKLRNDVRKQLEDWLVDSYIPETVLQYSKEEILGLVEEMIERLEYALTVQ